MCACVYRAPVTECVRLCVHRAPVTECVRLCVHRAPVTECVRFCVHRAPVTAIIPPPPDIQPVIDKLAEYVARNGVKFESSVRSKNDPR